MWFQHLRYMWDYWRVRSIKCIHARFSAMYCIIESCDPLAISTHLRELVAHSTFCDTDLSVFWAVKLGGLMPTVKYISANRKLIACGSGSNDYNDSGENFLLIFHCGTNHKFICLDITEGPFLLFYYNIFIYYLNSYRCSLILSIIIYFADCYK